LSQLLAPEKPIYLPEKKFTHLLIFEIRRESGMSEPDSERNFFTHLLIFEIRAGRTSEPDEITWKTNSAYGCLVGGEARHMSACSWLLRRTDGWTSFVYETLIAFFSQTIDAFCIPFAPRCYLQFMQQNKIKHG